MAGHHNVFKFLNSLKSATTAAQGASDSDSDEEYLRKKRSRGVRGCRGFSRHTSKVSEKLDEKSQVYSTQVSRCYSKMYAITHQHIAKDEASSDVEDEPVKGVVHKPPSPVLLLPSDSDLEESLTASLHTPEKDRSQKDSLVTVVSPSPPPPPPDLAQTHKPRRRQTKNLKKALQLASSARDQMNRPVLEQTPDTDVYVVDDNDVVTVRVEMMGRITRFHIRTWQPFSHIMSEIAKTEGVSEPEVMLVLRDSTIKSNMTPSSLNLKPADIIQGFINTNLDDSLSQGLEEELMIELCCQSRDTKRKTNIKAHKLKPLLGLMKDYASRTKQELSSLTFRFDGERLLGQQTPESLEMEDGDCIDVTAVK